MQKYVFEELVNRWGLNKTIQIMLLAIGTASISILIGVNIIPNDKS